MQTTAEAYMVFITGFNVSTAAVDDVDGSRLDLPPPHRLQHPLQPPLAGLGELGSQPVRLALWP
jgi:hypothetical protein